MAGQPQRVHWREFRDQETFLMIAEKDRQGAWRFFEKSAWEIHWYRVAPTLQHIARAEQLLTEQAPRHSDL